MIIILPALVLSLTAIALVILRLRRPAARYSWLLAVGGALLGLTGVAAWQTQLPATFTLLTWEPAFLFPQSIDFIADGISWPYAVSLSALTLAILLTSVTRPSQTSPYVWAGALALGGLGLLTVTVNNPLSLILLWGALDLAELVIQLSSVSGSSNKQLVVFSFTSRVLGILILVWANILSIPLGGGFDFSSYPASARLPLILAAGLRLGVLPLHLPYPVDSSLRRGIGTSLRMVSVASSLILLARVPGEMSSDPLTLALIALALVAAVYGGWMWLRAPDELLGRPYWIIGLAALSVAAALAGNPPGSVAWGCALILVGNPLFLASARQTWLERLSLLGAFGMSALPFSLTAAGWSARLGIGIWIGLAAHTLILAGYLRHAFRPSSREFLHTHPKWVRSVYPAGIGSLIVTQILLGLAGWEGALQWGNWPLGVASLVLALVLVWLVPRLRILTPTPSTWVNPITKGIQAMSAWVTGLHHFLNRIGGTITSTLEGDGGLMWTMLFLVLLVSLLSQGNP